MSKAVNELFNSIVKNQRKWIELVTAKTKCTDTSNDIYQDVNIKILERIRIGKIEVDKITNDCGCINYAYYYRVLMNVTNDYLRSKHKGLNNTVELSTTLEIHEDKPNYYHTIVDDIITGDVLGLDILIANKIHGVPYLQLAQENSTNVSKIWLQSQSAIEEIKNKYGTYQNQTV
jgi:hypothetical protein